MSTNALGEPVSMQAILLGRLLGALVILFMLFDGIMKVAKEAHVVTAMAELGARHDAYFDLGVLEDRYGSG